jgi:hypothetical protein
MIVHCSRQVRGGIEQRRGCVHNLGKLRRSAKSIQEHSRCRGTSYEHRLVPLTQADHSVFILKLLHPDGQVPELPSAPGLHRQRRECGVPFGKQCTKPILQRIADQVDVPASVVGPAVYSGSKSRAVVMSSRSKCSTACGGFLQGVTIFSRRRWVDDEFNQRCKKI